MGPETQKVGNHCYTTFTEALKSISLSLSLVCLGVFVSFLFAEYIGSE